MERLIRSIIVGILVAVFTVSCSTTHLVKPDEELAINKQATLVKIDNETIDVYSVFVSGDSLVAIDSHSNNELQFNRNEINRIVVNNRLKGAMRGLLIGGVSGVTLGLISGGNSVFSGAGQALFGGGFGVLFGPLPGYICGHKTQYVFHIAEAQIIWKD